MIKGFSDYVSKIPVRKREEYERKFEEAKDDNHTMLHIIALQKRGWVIPTTSVENTHFLVFHHCGLNPQVLFSHLWWNIATVNVCLLHFLIFIIINLIMPRPLRMRSSVSEVAQLLMASFSFVLYCCQYIFGRLFLSFICLFTEISRQVWYYFCCIFITMFLPNLL